MSCSESLNLDSAYASDGDGGDDGDGGGADAGVGGAVGRRLILIRSAPFPTNLPD